MKWKARVQKIWHDLFYAVAPERAADFAMTCKDASAQLDLKDNPRSAMDRFKLYLHVSLCEGCTNYQNTTRALKKAVRSAVLESGSPDRIVRLNDELVAKHSRTK